MARIRAEVNPARATSAVRPDRAPSSFWNFAWGTLALALAIFAVYLWNSNKSLQIELDRQEVAMKTQMALTEKFRAISALFTSPKTVTVNLAAKAPNATEPGRVVL